MDQNELTKAHSAKLRLDKTSPTFCTVKWKHATMNLGSGAVKSCCHLPFRKVDLNNRRGTSKFQLHDTAEDRLERAMMLRGEAPKNCSYCWWIEERGHLSDRITWSSKTWMSPYIDEVGASRTVEAKTPSWLELNFSNVCNLKCAYCSPIFSTKWLQEVKEHGPYPTDPGHNNIKYLQGVELDEKFDNTELMNLFWPWFEEVYPDVKLLKITGGEPFLSPHTFKLLEWVMEHPNKKMTLSINSNLSVPSGVWERFTSLVGKIQASGAIEKFYLHPSIDCFGERAEYIRFGLDFAQFQKNVEDFLDKVNGHVVFICTINNLALAGLEELWAYLHRLKQKYGARGQWISITSEVLLGPEWQNINILPESFQSYLQDTIRFVEAKIGPNATDFSTFELQGLQRALDMMRTLGGDRIKARANFYRFFSAHDQRRGTDIRKTFPEITEFYDECRRIAE